MPVGPEIFDSVRQYKHLVDMIVEMVDKGLNKKRNELEANPNLAPSDPNYLHYDLFLPAPDELVKEFNRKIAEAVEETYRKAGWQDVACKTIDKGQLHISLSSGKATERPDSSPMSFYGVEIRPA